MRKQQMYGIYDKVSMMFVGWPFKAMNEGEAMRTFLQLIQDGNTTISKNPHDFMLVHVGEFDVIDGKVKGNDINKNVMSGSEILKKVMESEQEVENA